MEEGRRRRINGASKKHETFREDVGGKAEDGVAVNTGVLEVDAGSTVGADNDLKLKRRVITRGGHEEWNNIPCHTTDSCKYRLVRRS